MNKNALEDAVAGLYRAAAGLEDWSHALFAASAVLHDETATLRLTLDCGASQLALAAGAPSVGSICDGRGGQGAAERSRREAAELVGPALDALCGDALPLSDAARRIVFHLREALLTAEACARAAALGPGLLDRLTLPVLLLDAAGAIRFLNAAAARELAGAGPLLRRDGRLAGRDPLADGQLHAFLAAVAREPAQQLGGRPAASASAPVLTGPARSGGPRRLALQAIPTALAGQPLLLVLLHDLAGARLPAVATLMRVYGMTPAQAEVTLALLRGLSADEVASERRVSSHTVRDQIAAVFAKTGVSRQAELVARLAALPTSLLGLE
ncbi:helix-turn-helix transcriptional regulator [Derxia lacustris]|uniref:helix-turn-helix transcriptional regulator n=1 Tax=Derxia lacustris TaxID=764842 RepID=UPI000A176BE2|nr:helix-turn-helix transcriptional regulator [Derxia lacustris]